MTRANRTLSVQLAPTRYFPCALHPCVRPPYPSIAASRQGIILSVLAPVIDDEVERLNECSEIRVKVTLGQGKENEFHFYPGQEFL